MATTTTTKITVPKTTTMTTATINKSLTTARKTDSGYFDGWPTQSFINPYLFIYCYFYNYLFIYFSPTQTNVSRTPGRPKLELGCNLESVWTKVPRSSPATNLFNMRL